MQFRRLRVLGKGVGRLRLAYKSSLDFFFVVFFLFFRKREKPKKPSAKCKHGPTNGIGNEKRRTFEKGQ